MGQRAMYFLRTPSAAGLSSPVDGMTGVVPVVPQGANGVMLLDARLLATRVVRPVGEPLVDADFGAVSVADAETVVKGWQGTEAIAEPKRLVLPGKVAMKAAPGPGASAQNAAEEKTDAQR